MTTGANEIRDDAEMIGLLMAAGVSANAQVPEAHNRAWEGMPMLGVAAIGAHVAAIRLLLEHGAQVDARLPASGDGQRGDAADDGGPHVQSRGRQAARRGRR